MYVNFLKLLIIKGIQLDGMLQEVRQSTCQCAHELPGALLDRSHLGCTAQRSVRNQCSWKFQQLDRAMDGSLSELPIAMGLLNHW